jgi:hypothetical protein
MKQSVRALCGVVLIAVLPAAEAMARPFHQSDLVCDVDGDGDFDDLSRQRPYAVILAPAADLWVSTINGLPPSTPIDCLVICDAPPTGTVFNQDSCGTTDASGKLDVQRLSGFASAASLGLTSGEVCADIRIELRASVGGRLICQAGFLAP